MKRGRLNFEAESKRDTVEDIMFGLSRARMLTDEVRLRVLQACGRSPLVDDVLFPADEDLEEICKILDRSLNIWKKFWEVGQKRKWK